MLFLSPGMQTLQSIAILEDVITFNVSEKWQKQCSLHPACGVMATVLELKTGTPRLKAPLDHEAY